MPTVPDTRPRLRDVAAPARAEPPPVAVRPDAPPDPDVPPPQMPALPEGLSSSERAAALLGMLSDPAAWLRRR